MSLPAAAAAAVDPAAEQPRRLLGIRHGIAMCAGMVIGSGIFKSTPMVAASISSPTGLLLVWLLGGALSFCGALCFAEMAAAFPDAGGDYHFLRQAYGPRLAFLFAWSRFAVIHTGFIAILAYVFADYVNAALPLEPHGTGWLAAVPGAAVSVAAAAVLRHQRVRAVRHPGLCEGRRAGRPRGAGAGHAAAAVVRRPPWRGFALASPVRAGPPQGSVRTFASRAHCRVPAAWMKALLSAASSMPASLPTPAAFSSGRAPASLAMALR